MIGEGVYGRPLASRIGELGPGPGAGVLYGRPFASRMGDGPGVVHLLPARVDDRTACRGARRGRVEWAPVGVEDRRRPGRRVRAAGRVHDRRRRPGRRRHVDRGAGGGGAGTDGVTSPPTDGPCPGRIGDGPPGATVGGVAGRPEASSSPPLLDEGRLPEGSRISGPPDGGGAPGGRPFGPTISGPDGGAGRVSTGSPVVGLTSGAGGVDPTGRPVPGSMIGDGTGRRARTGGCRARRVCRSDRGSRTALRASSGAHWHPGSGLPAPGRR